MKFFKKNKLLVFLLGAVLVILVVLLFSTSSFETMTETTAILDVMKMYVSPRAFTYTQNANNSQIVISTEINEKSGRLNYVINQNMSYRNAPCCVIYLNDLITFAGDLNIKYQTPIKTDNNNQLRKNIVIGTLSKEGECFHVVDAVFTQMPTTILASMDTFGNPIYDQNYKGYTVTKDKFVNVDVTTYDYYLIMWSYDQGWTNKPDWEKNVYMNFTVTLMDYGKPALTKQRNLLGSIPPIPVSKIPVSSIPVSSIPVSSIPVSPTFVYTKPETPFTEAPISTVAPFTEAPISTMAPFTEAPISSMFPTPFSTMAPLTYVSSTEEPLTEEPSTEEPLTEEPSTEEPLTDEPLIDDSMTSQTAM
jgi:hypothetical protein